MNDHCTQQRIYPEPEGHRSPELCAARGRQAEPELVQEVEPQLIPSLGSRSLLLDRGWTLPQSCPGSGAYAPHKCLKCSAFFETHNGGLDWAPVGDSTVLMGAFNAHVGNDGDP